RKSIQVTLMVNSEEIVVEVEDAGEGFDPDLALGAFVSKDRKQGRGLFLMRAYSSWISISDRGNCVTFGRRRSDRPKTIIVPPDEGRGNGDGMGRPHGIHNRRYTKYETSSDCFGSKCVDRWLWRLLGGRDSGVWKPSGSGRSRTVELSRRRQAGLAGGREY